MRGKATISEATPGVTEREPGLRIRHHVPRDPNTPKTMECVWCGQPTNTLAETPFAPEIGTLPLMVTCGAHLRIVYRLIEAGRYNELDAWELSRLAKMGRLIAERRAIEA